MNITATSLHWIDVGIIIAYGVAMIALGIYFGRRHDNADDYFIAGRRMLWPVIGISLFASNISSTTLIGLAGEAYRIGISVFNYESMAAVVLIFGVIFFFPFLLRSGVYTLPEFLERRYDSRVRTYFALLTLFLNIVVDTAGSLFAGALVLKLLFPDLLLWQTIALLAIAAGVYTIVGGLAAVMYTDAVQAILLIVASAFIAVAAFSEAGGWHAVMSGVPAGMISVIRPADDPGVPWPGLLTGIPLLGFYFWCTNQFMVQRVISAKNIDHARWGALFAGALKLTVLFTMVLPGTAAILLYPDLRQPDLVYPKLMFELMPTGLLGLALAGFIAALMSQIDSTLNSASTLVTMDFVRRAKPGLTSHQLMRIGQLATFSFMVLAVLWAPQIEKFGSLFSYLQRILSYAVPPVITMILAGLFWPRANSRGAIVTMVTGLVAGAVLFVLNEITGTTSLHFLYVAPTLFVICLVTMVVASLTTSPPPDETTANLTWTKAYYHEESAELRLRPWYQDYRVLSVILFAGFITLTLAFR